MMTYVVLALAVPAWVVVMRRGGQLPRILGLVYCAAGVALGYALVLGTLETGTVSSDCPEHPHYSRGRFAPAR